jgi:hypothetical protein
MKFNEDILNLAKSIQKDANVGLLPPVESRLKDKSSVLPQVLFHSTRGYLEKVVYQINCCYENTCYDACSVMIRRLTEILLIEVYEHHSLEQKIKDNNGEFFLLEELINRFLAEPKWNLSRNTKQGLKILKHIGDLSAHSRRYNANRHDLDKIIADLRIIAEELLYLAGMKV